MTAAEILSAITWLHQSDYITAIEARELLDSWSIDRAIEMVTRKAGPDAVAALVQEIERGRSSWRPSDKESP